MLDYHDLFLVVPIAPIIAPDQLNIPVVVSVPLDALAAVSDMDGAKIACHVSTDRRKQFRKLSICFSGMV